MLHRPLCLRSTSSPILSRHLFLTQCVLGHADQARPSSSSSHRCLPSRVPHVRFETPMPPLKTKEQLFQSTMRGISSPTAEGESSNYNRQDSLQQRVFGKKDKKDIPIAHPSSSYNSLDDIPRAFPAPLPPFYQSKFLSKFPLSTDALPR